MNGKIKLLILASVTLLSSCTNHYHYQPKGHFIFSPGSEKDLVMTSFDFASSAWFATNSANLRSAGRVDLDSFANDLLRMKGLNEMSNISNIQVIGHTDSRASHSYNQRLSENRARSVKNYLISRGIVSSKVTSKGMGETQPIASNDTDSGMQQNRRVEINVAGPAIRLVNY